MAEEIRRRGINVRHLHSWDDYDRFRKVPAGVDPSWSEHIGRPLSAVPDPTGELPELGRALQGAVARRAGRAWACEMVEVNQTEMYRAGTYRDQILTAIGKRDDDRGGDVALPDQEGGRRRGRGGGGRGRPDDGGHGATEDLARFPYKPYCSGCGRDTVTLTSYDDETTDLAYTCDVCGDSDVTNLATQNEGKLVWKVDWPMRWAFEGVDFEPAGVDHASPGSSYTVGKELVETDLRLAARRPSSATRSSASPACRRCRRRKGGVPTAADALKILEAPILRWLYVRRQPKQAFNVDFGAGGACGCTTSGTRWPQGSRPREARRRSAGLRAGVRDRGCRARCRRRPVVVPFRMLSSVADVTAGSPS